MRIRGDFPAILFSVETTNRELDSKLVMASALAAKGCRAIVGHKGIVKATGRASQHVIWQGKTLFSRSSSEHLANSLAQKGSGIMYLHDEGSMYQAKWWAQNVLWKHDVDQLGKVNRICVWGDRQKTTISDYARDLREKISVTGAPRFDICLSKFDWITKNRSMEISSKYSPFILFCSRFANAVSATGAASMFQLLLNTHYIRPPGVASVDVAADECDVAFSDWQQEVYDFADFVMLIKEAARQYPQYTLVLRPHPSEDMAFYEQAFASFQNVVVIREGSVLPWIRAADLVVHSNCTTGVEAVLAGRPVLNLLPARSGRSDYDIEIACEAGSIAASIDDAVKQSGELLTGEQPSHSWSAHARTMLRNLHHESIPALVVETMSVLQDAQITSSRVELPNGHKPERPSMSSYVRSKRQPLDQLYVEELLESCQANGVGGGRIEQSTEQYVVIDPA